MNVLFDNGTHRAETTGTIITPPPEYKITKLAFKQRMTPQERIDIRAAAQTDPVIFDFMDLISDAQFIDLSRQDTQDGVNYLEAQGHIAAGRANEILTNPIQDDERIDQGGM